MMKSDAFAWGREGEDDVSMGIIQLITLGISRISRIIIRIRIIMS